MISVIIPVYNGEKYIEKSVLSVIQQSYKDVELVVVNDGSTDSTEKILKDIWEQYSPKGKIINIENSGAAHARNVGLDNISGEYFCLLDSDDYLDTDIFESVFLFSNDFDICYYGYKDVDIYGRLRRDYNQDFSYIDNLTGVDAAILKLKRDIWLCHGNVVYKSNIRIIHDIKYIEGYVHGEDFCFITSMLSASSNVRCLNRSGVNITYREDSVMHSDYRENFIDAVNIISYLKDKIMTIEKARLSKDLFDYIDINQMDLICYVAKKIISSCNIGYRKKLEKLELLPNIDGKILENCINKISRMKTVEYFVFKNNKMLYFLLVKLFCMLKRR